MRTGSDGDQRGGLSGKSIYFFSSQSCKKITDDKGTWLTIEQYIMDYTELEFSHGICPECRKNLWPKTVNHLPEAQK